MLVVFPDRTGSCTPILLQKVPACDFPAGVRTKIVENISKAYRSIHRIPNTKISVLLWPGDSVTTISFTPSIILEKSNRSWQLVREGS